MCVRAYLGAYVSTYVTTCMHASLWRIAWLTANKQCCSSTRDTHVCLHTYGRTCRCKLYQHVCTYATVCMYVRIMKTQGNACKRKKRTVSGSTLNETMFWTREMFPEYPVTMLNYGSQLIIKLDDDGMRFVAFAFTDFVENLVHFIPPSKAPCDSPGEVRSLMRVVLGDQTTDVSGKIHWLMSSDTWEVHYRNASEKYVKTSKDHNGNSFTVPHGLDPEGHQRAKLMLRRIAIDHWNTVDTSPRSRIAQVPDAITLRRPSSSEQSASSQDLESTQES